MVIARPLVLPMIDGGMRELPPIVAAIRIGRDHRCSTRHGFAQHSLAGGRSTVSDDPAARFASRATDDMNAGRAVIGIGAMPRLRIGPPAWRIVVVGMGVLFSFVFW
jgi:hypothetical protein